jgi:hypothetical protein
MTKPPLQNIFRVFAVFVIALAVTLQTLFIPSVSAAQITNRKLTLMAGDSAPFDGGSKPGGTVRHFFEFTIPTTGTAIGSIRFQYCTTAADVGAATCQAPTAMSTAGVSLGSETGSGATGFTASSPSANVALLTKATAATPSNGDLKFQLDDILNPSSEGTFFVRIATYNSIDGTGSPIDSGTVAASTAEQIIVEGIMPESLVFCTGKTVSKTAGVPDCSTAGTGEIEFNQLFSPTDTAATTSQMAASTNAGFGYAITVNGPTLTSGSNTIGGITTPNASVKGVAQFGLNLRANTSAAAAGFDPGAPVGIAVTSADIDLTSNGTSLKGQATADYNTPDTFKFVSGNTIANSAEDDNTANTTGSVLGPTDAQIYTVSYIANVPGSQPAGTYTSTLTYICTPTF